MTPEEQERRATLNARRRTRELERLDRDSPGWCERYAPGSHGAHEAWTALCMISDQFDTWVTGHPAVLLQPQLYRLATQAQAAMLVLTEELHALFGDPTDGPEEESEP
jgi:hypothetical protein